MVSLPATTLLNSVPLKIGDRIQPSSQNLIELPKPRVWIHNKAKLNPDAKAQSISYWEPPSIRKELAIIVDRKRLGKSSDQSSFHRSDRLANPTIESFHLRTAQNIDRTQVIDLDFDKLCSGDLLVAHLFSLPQQSRVTGQYFLPISFPERTGDEASEKPTHMSSYISQISPLGIFAVELIFPLENPEFLKMAEKANGLALKVYAEHLVELSEKNSVLTALEFAAPRLDHEIGNHCCHSTNRFQTKNN